MQKEVTYACGIAKMVFSPFFAMKTFCGTVSTASIYFNFGTRCCGIVSCPLEEPAVSTTWEDAVTLLLMIVLIEGSEINYSVVTERGQIMEGITK